MTPTMQWVPFLCAHTGVMEAERFTVASLPALNNGKLDYGRGPPQTNGRILSATHTVVVGVDRGVIGKSLIMIRYSDSHKLLAFHVVDRFRVH